MLENSLKTSNIVEVFTKKLKQWLIVDLTEAGADALAMDVVEDDPHHAVTTMYHVAEYGYDSVL